MELILKSNDENSIAEIITLAKKLNVVIEQRGISGNEINIAKRRLLNFKASGKSSFGDAAQWEMEHRADRDIPFAKP